MQSTSFRLISGVVTILLLGSLALVVRLALLDNSTMPATVSAMRPAVTAQTPSPLVVAQPVPGRSTPAVAMNGQLASPQRVEAGGFSFYPLADYTLEEQVGSVNMLPQSASASTTPTNGDAFLLSGGRPTQFAPQGVVGIEDIFAQYVNYYAQRDNFSLGARQSITVDQAAGFAVDLTSIDPAHQFAGRIVMVQPATDQIFVMVGVAPAAQWATNTHARFDTVLASVTFFALTPAAKLAASTPATHTVALKEKATPQLNSLITPTRQPSLLDPVTPTLMATPVAGHSNPPPAVTKSRAHWQTYSNANQVNDLVVYKNTLWAAAQGGIVAWNLQNHSFVKFTTLEGLAANQATAVAVCPLPGLGIVFGSAQGLQIFDLQSGRWKHLNSSNSAMSFDDVSRLVCSVDNNFLLVGYQQHGLDILDARTGAWSYINQSRGLQNDFVEQVAVVGNQDAIWVASGAGVSVLTPQGATFINRENSALESNQITAMAVDKAGTVWLGAQNTVYKVSSGNWTVYSQLSVLASRFPAGDIKGLAAAEDGTLWIGSSKGEICHFDPVKVQCLDFFASADDPTNSMARGKLTKLALDSAGNVYYATDGSGLSRYDGANWTVFTLPDERLAGNEVHAIIQTNDRSIWVATEGGLQQMNAATGATLQLFTAENSGLTVTETGVLQGDAAGGLWFGARNASYYNGENWTVYTAADGLAGGLLQTTAVDNQKRIWFGTTAGLSVWNGSTFFSLNKTTGLPSEDVTALAADGDRMWIGTNGGGLFRFEKNQLQVLSAERLGLPSNVVTALALAPDQTLLVGTNQGLVRLRDNTATPIRELADIPIAVIAVQSDSKLWIGTKGDGLYYFDGQTWTQPTEKGLPPAQEITALLVDQQGSIWVGGKSGGLIRYTP